MNPPNAKRAPKTAALIQRHITDNEKLGWRVPFRVAMTQTQELIQHAAATEELLRELMEARQHFNLEDSAPELHRKLVAYFKESK